ncbi:class I SAM-dependent methyltransferase [Bradyrhizobium cosmicum]|uniref:class I SAM-dependent methyltransferase n=1 Tax=Bradyrhizobium cosmicum TaxID=1404864 RepID=UPI0011630E77|nr:class I SAM-dependent methyltransferase [Bradyrhizobium cosmicum]QDP26083.1 class I SAM-dependent methyltransferase [Bradyrhizobium cosmicum]
MADAVGTHFSPEIAAGGFSRVDGTVQFWQRVGALIGPQSVVLDFGAGRGAKQSEDLVSYRRGLLSLKGRVRDLIGVDVDPVVITNEALDRAFVITPDGELPIPDQSIDVVVSDFVFEHIQDPAMAARELDRVLKPGGWICARTPNRHGYIALGNRLIPDSLHARIIRSAQDAREEKDVFPAVYHLNSTSAFRQHFPASRYDLYVIPWDAEPAYYFGSKLFYSLFLAIQHCTPAPFKTVLMAFIHKRPVE